MRSHEEMMTLVDDARARDDEEIQSVRRQMFLDFCALLERNRIRYVILSGYTEYPDKIASDIDFMVDESAFARLPMLFSSPDALPGARLVQFLRHETTACYFVFARPVRERIAYLHPDASSSYRRRGRLWLDSEDVLSTRRMSPSGFWIPAAEREFEYYFVKRIDKGSVEEGHVRQLGLLLAEEPPACAAVLARYYTRPEWAAQIARAIRDHDIAWFEEHIGKLRSDLRASRPREGLIARALAGLRDLQRMANRIFHPSGLVVAVLGPDGSGKTTVIEHLERELAPAFRRTRRFHLRPHRGAVAAANRVTNPHDQNPRGYAASALKIMLFLAYYGIGWVTLVLPAKLRSTLIVFDRYYHDMPVDPLRYRLPETFGLVRTLAPMVPRPDLWLILAAPPEQLVSRKGEITLEAAHRLSAGYRRLADLLSAAMPIDSGAPMSETLRNAASAVCEFMATRTAQRIQDMG
ncbi:MAG: hypothetical protein IT531_19040 [Burkholderiales bacterium]|nr:hypothetical protein [Burkholderiales bacterium]